MDTGIGGGDPVSGDRRKSCDLCCSRKRRCDGDGVNPCTLCATKGVACSYSKKGRRGPKPKPKRGREVDGTSSFGGEVEGVGGMRFGEEGGMRSLLDWEGWKQDGAQPRPKMARMADVVRLTPSAATGTLGLQENRHLNAFFSGFGSCTQIVQEDEIRGAMIHVLSDGQFGMPSVDGESFYSSINFSSRVRTTFGGGDAGDEQGPGLKLIQLKEGGLGVASGLPAGVDGGGSEKELKQRAQRARLSAGVACLWAGIGVGAMLCGQTAEATSHYAENAREAIKGCYDVVSEEVLRAFLCLAHMHSFREDFPKFFRYTAMANDVAASLDRQGGYASFGKQRQGNIHGSQAKGCSEPAKFLLKCFDAMSHFLELEGEETNSPLEGIVSTRLARGRSSSDGGRAGGETRSPTAAAAEAERARTGARIAARIASEEDGQARMIAKDHAQERAEGRGEEELGVEKDSGEGAAACCKEKENEPRILSQKAMVAGSLRSDPSALAYEEFPGLKSAVRVQECISVLGDNPVAKRLGNFALSSLNSVSQGQSQSQGQGRGGAKGEQEDAIVPTSGDGGGGGGGSSSKSGSLKFPPMKTNQVLFVGDTRILEVSMGVDCSCISVMCKAVAGAPWSEIQADARIVADTADAILVPVLASPSISRSVCAVKLLANSAFAHLCLGNAEDSLRAVRRFSAILKEFPGIIRFPPWRHCFHYVAGMLESAGLRGLYDGLKEALNTINMKSMQNLPDFGEGAHDIMCKCSHFRCQATHRALAEHAKRDPDGAFQIPEHCPQYGTAAKAVAANGGSVTTFRAAREASEWAAKLSAVDSRSFGGVGIVGAVDPATRRRDSASDSAADTTFTCTATALSTGPSPATRPPAAARGTAMAPAARYPATQPVRMAPPMTVPKVPTSLANQAPSVNGNLNGNVPSPTEMFGGAVDTGAGGFAAVAERPLARTAAAAVKGGRGAGPRQLPFKEDEGWRTIEASNQAHPSGAGAHTSSFDFFASADGGITLSAGLPGVPDLPQSIAPTNAFGVDYFMGVGGFTAAGGGSGAEIAPVRTRGITAVAGGSGVGCGAAMVSSGFVGGRASTATGSELAGSGYTRDEQQLWDALCDANDGEVELSNAEGAQEEAAELAVFAQEIVGMLADETKAC